MGSEGDHGDARSPRRLIGPEPIADRTALWAETLDSEAESPAKIAPIRLRHLPPLRRGREAQAKNSGILPPLAGEGGGSRKGALRAKEQTNCCVAVTGAVSETS